MAEPRGNPLFTRIRGNRRRNIVIFGETGAGKSSVINMLLTEGKAPVNNYPLGCTFESNPYDFTMSNVDYRIWDTAGLNEADGGTVPADTALKYLRDLVGKLGSPGINLLVYCIRASRYRDIVKVNYDLFWSIICQKKVPVVVIVTGLENEDPMEAWWDENETEFVNRGLEFDGHACVTATKGKRNIFEEEYEFSVQAVRDLIEEVCPEDAWGVSSKDAWLAVINSSIDEYYEKFNGYLTGPDGRRAGFWDSMRLIRDEISRTSLGKTVQRYAFNPLKRYWRSEAPRSDVQPTQSSTSDHNRSPHQSSHSSRSSHNTQPSSPAKAPLARSSHQQSPAVPGSVMTPPAPRVHSPSLVDQQVSASGHGSMLVGGNSGGRSSGTGVSVEPKFEMKDESRTLKGVGNGDEGANSGKGRGVGRGTEESTKAMASQTKSVILVKDKTGKETRPKSNARSGSTDVTTTSLTLSGNTIQTGTDKKSTPLVQVDTTSITRSTTPIGSPGKESPPTPFEKDWWWKRGGNPPDASHQSVAVQTPTTITNLARDSQSTQRQALSSNAHATDTATSSNSPAGDSTILSRNAHTSGNSARSRQQSLLSDLPSNFTTTNALSSATSSVIKPEIARTTAQGQHKSSQTCRTTPTTDNSKVNTSLVNIPSEANNWLYPTNEHTYGYDPNEWIGHTCRLKDQNQPFVLDKDSKICPENFFAQDYLLQNSEAKVGDIAREWRLLDAEYKKRYFVEYDKYFVLSGKYTYHETALENTKGA